MAKRNGIVRGAAANASTSFASRGAWVRAEQQRNRRRLPLAKIPQASRETFRCERWSCSLSRFACSLRWVAARSDLRGDSDNPRPSGEYFRCRGCAIGEGHAALVRSAAKAMEARESC